jgi:uncharacterized alkaline shock family protein YloU
MTSAKQSESTTTKTTKGEVAAREESALVTAQGRTTVSDTVVEKIAGLAAREVRGVHNLGRGGARALGSVRERIPGGRASLGQGVSVEVGERQAAIDLEIVVEYGAEIGELSKAVRRNVINSLERMTALEVTEVNISINDVFVPGDEEDSDDPRVQ